MICEGCKCREAKVENVFCHDCDREDMWKDVIYGFGWIICGALVVAAITLAVT